MSAPCRHHHDLVALHDEPVRGNSPKHIGYVCPACLTLFTARHLPSESTVSTQPRLEGAPRRRNRSHAARLRAAERVGLRMVVAA